MDPAIEKAVALGYTEEQLRIKPDERHPGRYTCEAEYRLIMETDISMSEETPGSPEWRHAIDVFNEQSVILTAARAAWDREHPDYVKQIMGG